MQSESETEKSQTSTTGTKFQAELLSTLPSSPESATKDLKMRTLLARLADAKEEAEDAARQQASENAALARENLRLRSEASNSTSTLDATVLASTGRGEASSLTPSLFADTVHNEMAVLEWQKDLWSPFSEGDTEMDTSDSKMFQISPKRKLSSSLRPSVTTK